ncbi:unnamed protein product [Urochloa decumbens]|uniref:Uncharacterized protein n=1 Tax=Urochloa decumbens TaxID=240449 RepID=A0ABC9G0P7_9POAL
MDDLTIFHLNFVKALEEVAEHFDLEQPVISVSASSVGAGFKGAVHLQLRPHDPTSFTTVYAFGLNTDEAMNFAAREALKLLFCTLNFAFIDMHTYEYWEQLMAMYQKEQQHTNEISQLHQYHEIRRKQELDDLEQDHQDQLYEVKHDLNLEIEDRDNWLHEEELKNKKLQEELEVQGGQIKELMAENQELRQKLAEKTIGEKLEGKSST